MKGIDLLKAAMLVKGYACGQTLPPEIFEAINTICLVAEDGMRTQSGLHLTGHAETAISLVGDVTDTADSEAVSNTETIAPKEPKKRNWSPEQRQAASDRLRARRASGIMKKKSRKASADSCNRPR